MIKTGYRLLQVDTTNTASQIVFAGIRFALAGLFVLIFASIQEKKVTLPDGKILKYAVPAPDVYGFHKLNPKGIPVKGIAA